MKTIVYKNNCIRRGNKYSLRNFYRGEEVISEVNFRKDLVNFDLLEVIKMNDYIMLP